MDRKAIDPNTSFTKTSKTLDLSRRIFTKWVKAKPRLFEVVQKRDRLRLDNLKQSRALCEPMEQQLTEWVLRLRNEDKCVDGDAIKQKAMRIYEEIHQGPCSHENKPFNASSGWLQNFCRRNHLSFRRITTTG